jgi:catechol 2,3-dioxygenase-like lactoylglutathione lyase family enzyme
MGQVTGIGGIFFRSENPEALAAWYAEHLDISPVPKDYDSPVWQQAAGPTVFAPFPADTDYFGEKAQSFMINLRVAGLDNLVAKLRAAGVEVTVDPENYPNGRFARVHDPEGNPVELWEPA